VRDTGPEITVEFFAIPRLRAGQAQLTVRAATVSELLRALDDACPALRCLTDAVCRLNPQYLLSVNGQRFVADLDVPLQAGDEVLLLSADVGG
jgi:molybdopterin converting factor small subunit